MSFNTVSSETKSQYYRMMLIKMLVFWTAVSDYCFCWWRLILWMSI